MLQQRNTLTVCSSVQGGAVEHGHGCEGGLEYSPKGLELEPREPLAKLESANIWGCDLRNIAQCLKA